MPERETVALVLAGGGARGAYEVGALSVLLPALEGRGQRPRLVLGTSAGALNAAFAAATADQPAAEAVAEGERIWRDLHYGEVLRGLGSLSELGRGLAYLGEVLGLPVSATSLLDPAPLAATVRRLIPFDRLAANVAADLVQAAVVTTAAATSRSVVFHTQAPRPRATPSAASTTSMPSWRPSTCARRRPSRRCSRPCGSSTRPVRAAGTSTAGRG